MTYDAATIDLQLAEVHIRIKEGRWTGEFDAFESDAELVTALAETVTDLRNLLREANSAFDECTGDYPKDLVKGEIWRSYR